MNARQSQFWLEAHRKIITMGFSVLISYKFFLCGKWQTDRYPFVDCHFWFCFIPHEVPEVLTCVMILTPNLWLHLEIKYAQVEKNSTICPNSSKLCSRSTSFEPIGTKSKNNIQNNCLTVYCADNKMVTLSVSITHNCFV